MTDTSLHGKVALITGAGSGLGEATAGAFAAAGSAVACLDRDQAAATRVGDDIARAGGDALPVACDVSDPDAVVAAVDAVCDRFGRIDVAVNCAAVDYVVPVAKMTVEQWNRVIGVDLSGPFYVAREVFPIMVRNSGGDIINVASTAATRAWGNASAYHAAKWGLVGFSRGLGVEGREHGIRVTTVIPGGMKTHWFDGFPDQGIPLPDEANLQDPANVARTILFAVQMPRESALQEILVTPIKETSWP